MAQQRRFISIIVTSIGFVTIIQVYFNLHTVYYNDFDVTSGVPTHLKEFGSLRNSHASRQNDGRKTSFIATARRKGRRVMTARHPDDMEMNTKNRENSHEREIKFLMSEEELQWVKRRGSLFDKWYNKTAAILKEKAHPTRYTLMKNAEAEMNAVHTASSNGKNPPVTADASLASKALSFMRSSIEDPLQVSPPISAHLITADGRAIPDPGYMDKDGPWLDFVIIGNPKCGTTTLMANLGHLAPMPVDDICVGPGRTLKLAYHEWPQEYGGNLSKSIVDNNTVLRGSKCPRHINDWGIRAFATTFQKTKFIVGIRHPVLWFQSFWRMMAGGNPYRMMDPCPCLIDERTGKRTCPPNMEMTCFAECPYGQVFCLHRARMHLPLARLGKTALTDEERTWLSPQDLDGGQRLYNWNVPNHIFVYDQEQLTAGSYWDELATFLHVSHIPSTHYHASKGKGQSQKSLCDPEYDSFRSIMMPYSYEMSVWLINYFVPIARDPHREDVTVPNIEQFEKIVDTYKEDPCKRLIRNDANGAYMLDSKIGKSMIPPPDPSFILRRPTKTKKTGHSSIEILAHLDVSKQ